MKAIYYLIEQQYETGQALPVTGGQVMLCVDPMPEPKRRHSGNSIRGATRRPRTVGD